MLSRFTNEDLLSQGLVADILSVSKETVRKWIKSGKLPSPFNNEQGQYLCRWADLHKFQEVQDMLLSKWDEEQSVKPIRKYRSIELFAGAGGLALGLERAGFDSVALNEFDHNACDTLRKNRPQWNVIEGDISKIDFSKFTDIDFVSGGFPCQAFSYAGNRFGFEDARGTLFFEFARVICETHPKVFLGENVRGLLTHDNGRTIETIKSVIKDIGYTLVEPHVLKSIFYRVPQKRERLALVGVRNDFAPYLAAFKWPSPAQRVYTVRDAFGKGDLFSTEVPSSPGCSYSEWKADIIAKIPQGGYWRDLPIQLQKKLLKGSFHLEGGKTGIGRRLSWNEPSLTLTCAPAQNQTGRCHPEETRPLTVREYARIQTFPDKWEFCGSLMSQYKQIGNAVPVNLAEALGHSLISLLNRIEQGEPQEIIEYAIVRQNPSMSNRAVQLTLFEPSTLYLVHTNPVTLLGTYRKTCREWITANNLYNYPVSDIELESIQSLRSVCRLILKHRNDAPLFFVVNGYDVVDKETLAKLGYKVGKSHPACQKYILYKLTPLKSALEFDEKSVVPIVGKGIKS